MSVVDLGCSGMLGPGASGVAGVRLGVSVGRVVYDGVGLGSGMVVGVGVVGVIGCGVMVWGLGEVVSGSSLLRYRLFLVVNLPEPSVRTEYWWYWRTSTTVPDLSHFVG